ncbi:MAG TPA: hypothetical protein VGA52_15355 [Anaerolineales bacterium]|jgi:hypothetical protein
MTDQPIDPLKKVTETDDLLGKIRSTLSGFLGYVERDQRRESDKMLREAVADRYEKQWARVSQIQRDLIAEGQIDLIDDLEAGAIKLRAFIDRLRTASYGYAGLFDHARIGKDELASLYSYDAALLEHAGTVASAVDNVEASLGSDGLPAAIRHLRTVSQDAVDLFDRRHETIMAEA